MPRRQRSSSRRVFLLGLAAIVGAIAAVAVALTVGGAGNRSSTTTAQVVRVDPSRAQNPKLPGRVVFVSNFERGKFPEWFKQALPNRIRLVHNSPYEGRSNALFEVRPGDIEPQTGSPRAELTGPTFEEGDDIYVRTAFRVPEANTFQGPWQLIQQFHEAEEWGGSPGTAIFLTSKRRIRIGHGDGTEVDWQSKPLVDNRWYVLTYRVKFSQNPKVGFMEVWLNGKHQRLRDGHFRQYGFTMQKPHSYLKTGIYRSRYSTGISLIEDDSLTITQLPH
ncbi:MAG: heparin lyase I family protein [Actinobacteria bacterium]|nr:heparin lyase I family protein [Actinomycetota bacterium]